MHTCITSGFTRGSSPNNWGIVGGPADATNLPYVCMLCVSIELWAGGGIFGIRICARTREVIYVRIVAIGFLQNLAPRVHRNRSEYKQVAARGYAVVMYLRGLI